MSGDAPSNGKDARAERLAARLRDNLRRRKTQARALDGGNTPARDPDRGDRDPSD